MTLIFWAVFVGTIVLAVLACPRKAAPVFIVGLLALLVALGAGST